MEEYNTRIRQVTNTFFGLVLRIIPLTTICSYYFGYDWFWFEFGWIVSEVVKPLTTYLGIAIIFITFFMKLEVKLKIKLNLLGNAIFWLPIIIRAMKYSVFLEPDFYYSLALAGVCLFLQTHLLKRSVLINNEG